MQWNVTAEVRVPFQILFQSCTFTVSVCSSSIALYLLMPGSAAVCNFKQQTCKVELSTRGITSSSLKDGKHIYKFKFTIAQNSVGLSSSCVSYLSFSKLFFSPQKSHQPRIDEDEWGKFYASKRKSEWIRMSFSTSREKHEIRETQWRRHHFVFLSIIRRRCRLSACSISHWKWKFFILLEKQRKKIMNTFPFNFLFFSYTCLFFPTFPQRALASLYKIMRRSNAEWAPTSSSHSLFLSLLLC